MCLIIYNEKHQGTGALISVTNKGLGTLTQGRQWLQGPRECFCIIQAIKIVLHLSLRNGLQNDAFVFE